MGKLSSYAVEVKLAVTLFLILLGVANFFGAWQVKNYSAFTPSGIAAGVGRQPVHSMDSHAMNSHSMEMPVDLNTLDQPVHHIDRELLIQDTHVHLPAYAMTSALLSLIVFGLRLRTTGRVALVLALFCAPALDFIGLWGIQIFPSAQILFATICLVGGLMMALAYCVVLALSLKQMWFSRPMQD